MKDSVCSCNIFQKSEISSIFDFVKPKAQGALSSHPGLFVALLFFVNFVKFADFVKTS